MNRRGPALKGAGVIAVLAFILLNVAIPVAQAATYTYANGVSTPEGQPRTSGLRSSVTGGSASVQLGIGSVAVVTYYDYPGYSQVGFASSDSGSTASMTHARHTNAHSKCYWSAHNVGGSAKLTCSVKS